MEKQSTVEEQKAQTVLEQDQEEQSSLITKELLREVGGGGRRVRVGVGRGWGADQSGVWIR